MQKSESAPENKQKVENCAVEPAVKLWLLWLLLCRAGSLGFPSYYWPPWPCMTFNRTYWNYLLDLEIILIKAFSVCARTTTEDLFLKKPALVWNQKQNRVGLPLQAGSPSTHRNSEPGLCLNCDQVHSEEKLIIKTSPHVQDKRLNCITLFCRLLCQTFDEGDSA